MNEALRRNIAYILRVRKPKLYLKLARMYFEMLVLKRVPPRFFDVSVGYNCNLRCEHCFNKKLGGDTPLSLEDYQRIARDLIQSGAFIFYFQGGEIFTIKGYEQIIEAFTPHENFVAVTSNGLLATGVNLAKLKALGVDVMIFSLDSGDPEKHDRFRGKDGVFASVIRAIELARALGFSVAVNTTLTHQNVRSEDTLRLFEVLEQYNIKVNTLFAAPAGNWHQRKEVLLDEDDVAHYYNVLRKRFSFLNRDLENSSTRPGCPAGKEIFYLDPYGNVFACPFIHLTLGNLRQESFSAILERIHSFGDPVFETFSDTCFIAEDEQFIEQYLDFTKDLPLPSNCESFFTHRQQSRDGTRTRTPPRRRPAQGR